VAYFLRVATQQVFDPLRGEIHGNDQ